MPLLVRYDRATGAIVGTWESNSLAVLQAQQVEEHPLYAYLLSTASLTASTVEHAYQVIDGALVPRPAQGEEQ